MLVVNLSKDFNDVMSHDTSLQFLQFYFSIQLKKLVDELIFFMKPNPRIGVVIFLFTKL